MSIWIFALAGLVQDVLVPIAVALGGVVATVLSVTCGLAHVVAIGMVGAGARSTGAATAPRRVGGWLLLLAGAGGGWAAAVAALLFALVAVLAFGGLGQMDLSYLTPPAG